MNEIIPVESIISKILLIRGQKVIIDSDIAKLYDVTTKRLNEQVKRNIERFPIDFMFQLTKDESESLRSQFATSKGKGGRRYLPLVFTELGVAMLSSVLNSNQAIEVNIIIMRAFVKLRELISTSQKVEEKLKDIDAKLIEHDEQIINIIDAINKMLAPPEKPKQKIGFSQGMTMPHVKEPRKKYAAKKGKEPAV